MRPVRSDCRCCRLNRSKTAQIPGKKRRTSHRSPAKEPRLCRSWVMGLPRTPSRSRPTSQPHLDSRWDRSPGQVPVMVRFYFRSRSRQSPRSDRFPIRDPAAHPPRPANGSTIRSWSAPLGGCVGCCSRWWGCASSSNSGTALNSPAWNSVWHENSFSSRPCEHWSWVDTKRPGRCSSTSTTAGQLLRSKKCCAPWNRLTPKTDESLSGFRPLADAIHDRVGTCGPP